MAEKTPFPALMEETVRERGHGSAFVSRSTFFVLIFVLFELPDEAAFLPPVQPKPPVYHRHLCNSTRHSIPPELPTLSNRRHLSISCPDSQSQNKSIQCPRIDINWIKYQCTNKELLMSSPKQQMRVLIIQNECKRPICFGYGDVCSV